MAPKKCDTTDALSTCISSCRTSVPACRSRCFLATAPNSVLVTGQVPQDPGVRHCDWSPTRMDPQEGHQRTSRVPP